MLLAAHIIQKEQEYAIAKGIELGIKQGKDKAYKDADQQLAAYFNRMNEALDAGEPFTKPLPTFHRTQQ